MNTALLLYTSCQRPSTGAGLPAKGSAAPAAAADPSRDLTSVSILARCAAVARVPRSSADSSDNSSSFVALIDAVGEGWKGVGMAGCGAAGVGLRVVLVGRGPATADGELSGLAAGQGLARTRFEVDKGLERAKPAA